MPKRAVYSNLIYSKSKESFKRFNKYFFPDEFSVKLFNVNLFFQQIKLMRKK